MNKKEENFKDNFCIFIFLLFFVLILHYIFSSFVLYDDDVFFSTVLSKNSLLDFLKTRYLTWSSRILPDALLAIIAHLPDYVWKILHSIIILFTVVAIYEITIPKDKTEYVFIIPLLFMFMPLAIFNDTGWIATTLNYAWPFAACMPFFVILKKTLLGESKTICKAFYIFSFFALIFACNQEQFCPLILVSSAFMIFYDIWQNRSNSFSFSVINRYFIFSFLIAFFCFLIIALCPGNNIRYEASLKSYPDFVNLSFFEKLNAGFLITMTYFFTMQEVMRGGVFAPNYIIFPLFIIMAINFLFKKKYAFLFCCVLIICFSLFFGFFQDFNLFKNNRLGAITQFSNKAIFIETFVFAIILCLTFACIFASFSDRKKSFIATLIMLAGFATRMIMAFSPTMYPSNTRPSYAMAVGIVVISALVFVEFVSTSNISFRKVLYGIFAIIILFLFAIRYRTWFTFSLNWEFLYKTAFINFENLQNCLAIIAKV